MKKSFKAMLLSLAAMFLAVSAYAQVTTASMSGKVTDTSGPVVGAAVVVSVVVSVGGTVAGTVVAAVSAFGSVSVLSPPPEQAENSIAVVRKRVQKM